MSRPDPIQYAERLYASAANFAPISFLGFGNAVEDGVDLRRMPRIAAEPFIPSVGDMLDLEEEAVENEGIDADIAAAAAGAPVVTMASASSAHGQQLEAQSRKPNEANPSEQFTCSTRAWHFRKGVTSCTYYTFDLALTPPRPRRCRRLASFPVTWHWHARCSFRCRPLDDSGISRLLMDPRRSVEH